ncbi:hypothetical protein OS493_040479 [Desmophyllum pertusum]|uniref:Uncharacterized protein n=1 Tax=Desmophyllum pertusum TaxID=174260 RepID=A0A9X0CH94_9CNID|nr:hypothetical protein OS493_040479 [Desmophyllum pertusum]
MDDLETIGLNKLRMERNSTSEDYRKTTPKTLQQFALCRKRKCEKHTHLMSGYQGPNECRKKDNPRKCHFQGLLSTAPVWGGASESACCGSRGLGSTRKAWVFKNHPGDYYCVDTLMLVQEALRLQSKIALEDLNVSDLAESGLKVNQPASFSVQTNAAVGDVTASVLAPSGDEKEAQVSKLGGGNFAIRFTPREFGDHLVNVRFDGSHIPGSPFKIRVGGAEGHPEKVKAYGEGLSKGESR